MTHLCVCEIPQCHIMNRWTKDARDLFPSHLIQQEDKGGLQSKAFRHSNGTESVLVEEVGAGSLSSFQVAIGLIAGAKEELLKIQGHSNGTESVLVEEVDMSLDEDRQPIHSSAGENAIMEHDDEDVEMLPPEKRRPRKKVCSEELMAPFPLNLSR